VVELSISSKKTIHLCNEYVDKILYFIIQCIPLSNNIKEVYFVHTVVAVKNTITQLKALPVCMKYTALDEGLETNIALGFKFISDI